MTSKVTSPQSVSSSAWWTDIGLLARRHNLTLVSLGNLLVSLDIAPKKAAAKRVAKASGEAAKWSDQTWRKSLRPALKDAWKRRTIALGAAGAAVPAGREIVEVSATVGLPDADLALGAAWAICVGAPAISQQAATV